MLEYQNKEGLLGSKEEIKRDKDEIRLILDREYGPGYADSVKNYWKDFYTGKKLNLKFKKLKALNKTEEEVEEPLQNPEDTLPFSLDNDSSPKEGAAIASSTIPLSVLKFHKKLN